MLSYSWIRFFLSMNTTSHWQLLDAGIIQSFKTRYRKKLMRYDIARINDDLFTSEVAKSIGVLQAITWVADHCVSFAILRSECLQGGYR